jgi:hypothetical protein
MSLQSRREYLEKISDRYGRVGRQYKTKILDEFCANCGYHRKHALRLLRRGKVRRRTRPGPKLRYGPQLLGPLKELWLASDQLCSKRLQAALKDWVPYLKAPVAVKEQLLQMSPATIDRKLRPLRAQLGRQHRSGTKPGSLLKRHIPIRTSNADITQAGYIEADTVAHCGGSMAGDFVWTLTFTDVATGYTLCRAVWNKAHTAIHQQLRELEGRLPFALQAFDCDNGSEFLNQVLLDHFHKRPRPIAFTRCRPYHKNDQAHVEQKNWTAVRQLIGYERLDCPQAVEVLNDLYRQEWDWYVNFFCPTLKLQNKQRVGARYVKRYEHPRTPYERLIHSPAVSPKEKERLSQLRRQLNPFKLRQRIEGKLKHLFALVRHQRRVADAGGASWRLAAAPGSFYPAFKNSKSMSQTSPHPG